MPTQSDMSHSIATKPCGCGAPAVNAAACGCNKPECANCSAPGLVRPQFFAGQLLTEEDLALLGTYVTAKNRLHNRHLFGDGIVCGLEVECHPCGGGNVVVYPGYALDCCGNDVVVPCRTELDINLMARNLQLHMQGYDCGDPCKHGTTPAGEPKKPGEQTLGVRHYCLYVSYCEQATDPVAPYATDAACGHQGCVPTRIREGYRFDLRCRDTAPKIIDLIARLRECLGDLGSTARILEIGRDLDADAAAISAALVPTVPAAMVSDTKVVALSDALTKAAAKIKPKPTRAQVQGTVTAMRELMQEIAHQQLAGANVRTGAYAVALTNVVTTHDGLSDASRAVLTGPCAAPKARALRDAAVRWLDPNQPVPTAGEARLLQEGIAWSAEVAACLRRDLEEVREWLVIRVDRSHKLGDCTIRRDLEHLRFPTSHDVTPTDGEFRDLARGMVLTSRALARHLLDCFCAVLNPPCRPCDDLGVLLACVTVRDCEVVDVCALERRWVISGPSARYWLPLERLGRALEILCCDPFPCDPSPSTTSQGPPKGLRTFSETIAHAIDEWRDALKAAHVKDEDVDTFRSIAGSLGILASAQGLENRLPTLIAALTGAGR